MIEGTAKVRLTYNSNLNLTVSWLSTPSVPRQSVHNSNFATASDPPNLHDQRSQKSTRGQGIIHGRCPANVCD
jgi:hypothetical protein